MVLHIALNHVTSYTYDRPVSLGPQIIRLRPAPHCRTPILSYSLTIAPKKHFLNWQQDPQGNFLARLVVPDKTTEFRIEVDLTASMPVINPFDFFLEEYAEEWPFRYESWMERDLAPYLIKEAVGPKLGAWLASVPREAVHTVTFLTDVNRRLQQEIAYLIRMEPGVQACEETLTNLSGSCRDSAWLMVQICRNLGLAARFVSGYLIQLVPDVKPLDGPQGPSSDFTDLHAWCEVYLPGAGWVGLDPTSGLLTGEGHIPLACTPEPMSAAPVTGSVDDAESRFDFSMSVTRVRESPRVTKPYTEDRWQAIEALGYEIDRELVAGDVRLTMGGEPTFVAVDDMDGAEWNTAAVGPTKRRFGDELIRRLRERFAPGGMLHYGQGKWYPGESLPRWAFGLYWRADGKPMWRNPDLIAAEKKNLEPTVEDAGSLAVGVAKRLDIEEECAQPAYEDPWHFLAKEQGLPENLDPLDSKLEDPEERARLARVFQRGLGNPSGFVLPVQRWNAKDGRPRWKSERWKFRKGRIFLVPGDSPVGFRLPLGGLPHIPPSRYPFVVPADPFAPRPPLPDQPDHRRQPFLTGRNPEANERQEIVEQGGEGPGIRTAMSIEPRDGRLCVFMPPTETLEDYFDLLAAVEDTAAEINMPLHIEGYPPPPDPRLKTIKVTPDPGVVEVNVQPAASWPELVDIVTGLYEDAHRTRLGTEKFMLDGRHTGTGGGNHVVVGGPTAPDSPFLRRPDLLRSLVAYWQNHPSLSYLFSGMFVGPTCQAPRVDEARDDSLYELSIAFAQVPEPEDAPKCPPWLVDRIFRNLLIDVTGNTHRAEICIDKLYSPDGPTGRLGLVEFRAFEMPPHARMSLTQQLLLRALIARFWKEPYRHAPIRWGNDLHDRFMLPHFVWRDMTDVLADMRGVGYAFEDSWFAPHFEFRFPLYGSVNRHGVVIELRQALEPWHVMGEEGAVGGTVRYVDSSVERLQVRVEGMTGDRFAVACNGHRVPLKETGTPGESVAGVRFRAWQPAACLHPTIGVHAPLTFDLVDTWTGRSLGGCTYHVAHPGGRNYETFPVNANEAESRRIARFFDYGHTPGPMSPPPLAINPDFPATLDLRLGRGG